MIPEYDDKILRWIDANNLLNSKGEKFEWYEHQFLIDPLCDWHPQQGQNKASQLGASESIGVLKSIFAAKEMKFNVIYTLPTDQFLQKFVPAKFNKIVENNKEFFHDITGGLQLKHIGSGLRERFINFTGTFNSETKQNRELSSKGVSFTSDLNIHDEASRSDQFILNQLRSRLDNSLYKGRWLYDNPTYPLMGADSIYQKSDQKHWIIKCWHCGYRQYLDWQRLDKVTFEPNTNHCFVDVINNKFICGKCGKEISDANRITGQWVAKNPNIKEYRGYWMPQMIYVRHNVASIKQKEEDNTLEKSFFSNFTLAKPYESSDIKISKEHIVANLDGNVNHKYRNAIGVDQGNTKWYVIGNSQGIFKVGSTESWDEIEFMKNKYDAVMVTDALPFQQKPKYFTKKYKNVYRAFYKPEADQVKIAQFGTKDDSKIVLIKREDMFDTLAELIVDGNFPIQVPLTELEKFIEHWTSLVKIIQPDKQGNERFVWMSTTGNDHLAHATLYWAVAMMKNTRGESINLGVPGKSKPSEIVHVENNGEIKQNLIEKFTKHLK